MNSYLSQKTFIEIEPCITNWLHIKHFFETCKYLKKFVVLADVVVHGQQLCLVNYLFSSFSSSSFCS